MENNSPQVLNEEEEEEDQHVQENGGSDDDDDDDMDEDDDNDNDGDAEMNYIRLLFTREIINPGLNDQQAASINNDRWLRLARTIALLSMLMKGYQFQFLVRRVYISVIYLTRFLASATIHGDVIWGLWVLGVTCLSLSAQMDENRIYVPDLSQYEYRLRDDSITAGDIRRMQRMVLRGLNWNIHFVTPFPFADFFLSRFNRQVSEATRMRIVLFILMAIIDVRLMIHRPSVIAVAAILLAVNNNLTRQELEIEINVLPLNGFLDIDNVWYCYNRLRVLNNLLR